MAVKIRLTRMGRKKRPFYRIVVADARFPRDGRYIENIGTYNPITEPPQVSVAEDRAIYWLDNGALPTQTVRSLLKKEGILHKRFLLKRGFDEARLDEEMKKWEVIQLERKRKAESAKAESAKAKTKAKKKEEEKAETPAQEAAPEAKTQIEENVPEAEPQVEEAVAEAKTQAQEAAPEAEKQAEETVTETKTSTGTEEAAAAETTQSEAAPAEEAPADPVDKEEAPSE